MVNEYNLISYDLDLHTNNNYLTHNYHPYPAKFIPEIPKEIILKLSKEGDWILDPFCGCGTALVESALHNRNSVGIDINPISVLVSKVKTTTLSQKQINEVIKVKNTIVAEIQLNKKYKYASFKNIDLWFPLEVQEALSVIKHNIESIKEVTVKDFLNVAFSSIIVRASNQESDTRYSAIEKNIKNTDVARFFDTKVGGMIERMNEYSKLTSKSQIRVFKKDSTKSLEFIGRKVDLAVTSPPYMNSYDYYLYHKHRMHWLGLDYKEAQDKEFGSRNKHNDKGLGVDAYTQPIKENAKAVKMVLKKGGYYCVVVGDAILKGKLIRMNSIFDEIFKESGYKKVREISFDQRKYTRTFTKNTKTEYKDSYILIYQN